AERLKHAALTVAEMQAKQRHADDVEAGDPSIAEADDPHFENVVAFWGIREVHDVLMGEIDPFCLHREVQEMINEENEDDDSAHQHGTRSVSRADGLPFSISDREGSFVLVGTLHSGPDVQ